MTGRSNRKVAQVKGLKSSPLSTIQKREAYLLWILQSTIDELYQGVVKDFVRGNVEMAGQYGKINHLYRRIDRNNNYFSSTRVKNTLLEGKLATHVAATWEKMGDAFPKWSEFFTEVKRSYGDKNILPENVKKILNAAGVRTVQAKNIANAENLGSCESRLNKISILLDFIKKNDIEFGSTRILYYFDECHLNQLGIQDETYLSPCGVQVFKPHHYTTHTGSLSLLLLVDNNLKVIHYKLRRNKEDGGTDWKVITDFLIEAMAKVESNTATIYLDNAPCHKKAFGSKLDDNSYKVRKEKMLKSWSPIFAPPCTPESNLAEYFFADLKKAVRSKLGPHKGTMNGPNWYQFVNNILQGWISTHRIKPATIHHIDQYLNRLVEVKGNVQLEAIKRAGYKNKEDLFLSVNF